MKSPTPDPLPSHFHAVRSLFERARALPETERAAFVRKEAQDESVADQVLAMFALPDAEVTAWLRHGAAAGAGGSGDKVQSTATDELLQKLKTAPKLDGERFKLEGELGKGGMGVVMKIHDQHLHRRLAMKVLIERSEPQNDEERRLVHQLLGRFLEEAQVTSQLDHPGVVPVHELGLDQSGKVYFTMRLVKGRTASEVFADAFADTNDWTTTRALEVVLKVCDTMAYAHDKGVLHRDLKPSNVMVGRFGEVYVMDWGLAKVTGQADRHDLRIRKDASGASRLDTARKRDAETDTASSVVSMDGQQLGTPSYMAPEQARSQELDVRADVYSIGAMMYELLTGRAPYTTPGVRQPAYRILNDVDEGPPKRIEDLQKGVPAELVAIVEKAMSREREQRYANTLALAADLRAYLAQRTVKAYRTGALVEMRLWVRRNRALAASLAAAVLILVAGLTVVSTKNQALAAENKKNNVFAAVARLADARRREEDLYPAWPDKVPAMESWLREHGEPLAQGLPALQAQLTELEAKAKLSTAEQRAAAAAAHSRWPQVLHLRDLLAKENDAQQRMLWQADLVALECEIQSVGYEFADSTDKFVHGVLFKVIQEQAAFVRDKLPGVRERLATARQVEQQTITAYRAKWDEAIAAIAAADGKAASTDYRGAPPLKPQMGLVPLAMDPTSKLWEFVHLASGTPGKEIPERDANGRLIPTGDMGIVFVLIPGGSLPPETPASDDGSRKRLSVKLDAFFLSKYEMTEGQWVRLTGLNPNYIWTVNDATRPITGVNWFDSEEVLRHQGFVLPTELRWEYACRGNTSTLWWTGDSEDDLVGMEAVGGDPSEWLPIASKQPNPFGLFDMVGGQMEWCLETSSDYGTEQHGDGRRQGQGPLLRCLRGGSHYSNPEHAQSGYRHYDVASSRRGNFGLRPARALL